MIIKFDLNGEEKRITALNMNAETALEGHGYDPQSVDYSIVE